MTASSLYTGFLLAEDAALKAKLSGVKIRGAREGFYDVPVRFRYPEGHTNPSNDASATKGVTYPLITIDLLSIVYDRKRDHAGNVYIFNLVDELPSFDTPTTTEYPLPVVIQYQVTAWASDAQSSRALAAQLMQPNRLPLRHGWMHVPADDTFRLMTCGPATQDNYVNQQGKRLFRTIYSANVESEMLKTELAQAHLVTTVILDPPTHVPSDMHGVY